MSEGERERAVHELRLEERLLKAAEDLMSHQNRRVMSLCFPNAHPAAWTLRLPRRSSRTCPVRRRAHLLLPAPPELAHLFLVVGQTPQLAELLAAATREIRGED